MSLVVKEIFVFSFSLLFLAIQQNGQLNVLMFTAFLSACGAQYLTKQSSFARSLGLVYRIERDSGLVVGSMLVPVSMLALARTVPEISSIYLDYISASFIQTMVMIVFVVLHKSIHRVSAICLCCSCFLCILFCQGRRVYFASSFLGCINFRCLVYLLPGSFTIGEAMVISQALSLFSLDGINNVLQSIPMHPVYVCLQVLINGVFVICIFLSPVLMKLDDLKKTTVVDENEITKGQKSETIAKQLSANRSSELIYWSCIFYSITTSVILCILFPLLSYLLDEFIIAWAFKFIFASSTRVILIASWVAMVLLACVIVYTTDSSSTIVRKYFHLIAVAIFTPGIILDAHLVYLASAGALFIFLLMEVVRVFRVLPFGHNLHDAFSIFIDERDSGVVILTHIYLLLGFALPVWLSPHLYSSQGLGIFSGVISLGIGDTTASVIGSKYGKHTWSAETNKTVEGSLAAILAQLLACCAVTYMSGEFYIILSSWPSILVVVTLTSLLEAFTSQIDNLLLPLFMFSVFEIIM